MSRVRGHKRISRIVSLLSILGLLIPYFAVSTPTKAADDAAPEVFFSGASIPAKYGPLNIPVSANDPDGDFITSWTYSISPQPIGETQLSIRHAPANDLAVLTWTPVRDDLFNQDGSLKSYEATFCAYNALSGCATNEITFYLVPNTGPTLDPIGDKAGFVGVNLAFDVTASDEQGDPINFTATASPNIFASPYTATFSVDGHFDWTPDITGPRNTYITFCAIDHNPTGDLSDCENITITVDDANSPPVLTNLDGPLVTKVNDTNYNATLYRNETLNLTVRGMDPDLDPYSFTARPDPSAVNPYDANTTWLGRNFVTPTEFKPSTGEFTWTPGHTANVLGTHTILFCVYSPPQLNDCVYLHVTVLNRLPVLTNLEGPQVIRDGDNYQATIYRNETLTFTAKGYDPDDDPHSFTAQNVADTTNWPGIGLTGADFNPNTGLFTWTPGHTTEVLGPHLISICIYSNPQVYRCTTITVTVLNRPPTIDPIDPLTVYRDQTIHFFVTGSDPDDDLYSFTIRPYPSTIPYTAKQTWLGRDFIVPTEFKPSTGEFTWAPDDAPLGTHQILFCIYSNPGVNDCKIFEVTLLNRLPVANITISTGPYCTGKEITFDGRSSTDQDGTITNSTWLFGDGTAPYTSGLLALHTYALPNTYQAQLTTIDNDGGTNSTTTSLTVKQSYALTSPADPSSGKVNYQLGGVGLTGFSYQPDADSGFTVNETNTLKGKVKLSYDDGLGTPTSIRSITSYSQYSSGKGSETIYFQAQDLDSLFEPLLVSTDKDKDIPVTMEFDLFSPRECDTVKVSYLVKVKNK